MLSFMCSLWPWLAGALLGWLLCGWLARKHMRRADELVASHGQQVQRLNSEVSTLSARAPVERIVEKIVDRPVEKIVEKIVEKPVERVVEKIVDRPVEKIVEKIVDRPVDRIVEKIVDRPVEKIVEKIVEKRVDNPDHLSKIALLTAEVGTIALLKSRISQFESAPPKVVEKVVDRPVEKIVEKIIDRPVEKIVEKIVEKVVEKRVDNPEHLKRIAALTAEIGVIPGLRGRISQLEAAPAKTVEKIVEKFVDRPVEKIVEKIVDRPVEKIVEKVVERRVDNPDHLKRIALLTAEVGVIAGLRGRISQLEAAPPKTVEKIVEKIVDRPVEKIVEKIVDRPVEKIVEKIVDRPVEKIVEKIVDRPVDRIVEKIVDRPVDRVVEKVVEKRVDNPEHLQRIAALTAEVAVIAGLRSRIGQLESAPAKVVEKIVEKIVDRPVEKIVEKIVDRPVDRVVEKVVEKVVDRPVDRVVEKLVDRPDPAVDLAAARGAGFTIKAADDLEVIEGIGPKISELLRADGIRSFAQLSRTPVSRIQGILDKAGPTFRTANPGTWPEQALLAANNHWASLKSLTDTLVGGVRVDTKARQTEQNQAEQERTKGALQRVSALEAELAKMRQAQAQAPKFDQAAAREAGFGALKADDLEVVEGIGPKIAELFHAEGVTTWAQLARMTPAQIQPMLDKAGPNYRLANPQTWPDQADLAARNRWAALKAMQDSLTAGRKA